MNVIARKYDEAIC